MGKLIALIVSIVVFLAGIILTALGLGIGLLLLIVGLLGTVMMGIIVGSIGGSYSDFFTPRGFFDAAFKTKVEKKETGSVWDKLSQKKDKN